MIGRIRIGTEGRFAMRSNATNAYQLLKDVAECIRAEPLRYNQGVWIDDTRYRDRGPACGTIGCRAGWMVVLAGPGDFIKPTVPGTARTLLGDSVSEPWLAEDDYTEEKVQFHNEVGQLFDGNALDYELGHLGYLISQKFTDPTITPLYAEAGARGLELFAEKWETRLVRTPIQNDLAAATQDYNSDWWLINGEIVTIPEEKWFLTDVDSSGLIPGAGEPEPEFPEDEAEEPEYDEPEVEESDEDA